jgi:hypothetical protein
MVGSFVVVVDTEAGRGPFVRFGERHGHLLDAVVGQSARIAEAVAVDAGARCAEHPVQPPPAQARASLPGDGADLPGQGDGIGAQAGDAAGVPDRGGGVEVPGDQGRMGAVGDVREKSPVLLPRSAARERTAR